MNGGLSSWNPPERDLPEDQGLNKDSRKEIGKQKGLNVCWAFLGWEELWFRGGGALLEAASSCLVDSTHSWEGEFWNLQGLYLHGLAAFLRGGYTRTAKQVTLWVRTTVGEENACCAPGLLVCNLFITALACSSDVHHSPTRNLELCLQVFLPLLLSSLHLTFWTCIELCPQPERIYTLK